MTAGVEVLLVEDNPNDVELTLHAFEKNNLTNKIKVVRDGAEALDYLFSEGEYAGSGASPMPRLILLDLKLPKRDGMEVLREIRADERTKHVPVVVLTSSQQESDIVKTYELGVSSYIVKPVDFDQFTEAVRTMGFYWLLLNEPPPQHVPIPIPEAS